MVNSQAENVKSKCVEVCPRKLVNNHKLQINHHFLQIHVYKHKSKNRHQ